MIWLATKKRMREYFDRLKEPLITLTSSIADNKKSVESNKDKINDLLIRVSVMERSAEIRSQAPLSQSPIQSHSQRVSLSRSQSQPLSETFETRVVNRLKRNKKALTMAEISKLAPSHSVIEMFDVIVLEKGLCSKASFYRYVASLKSQDKLMIPLK